MKFNKLLTSFLVTGGLLFSNTIVNAEAYIQTNGSTNVVYPEHYIGFMSTTENMGIFQSVIDQGYVAMQAHPLSVNDGLNTHFYAHNPGAFSNLAANLYEGAIVTVTDFNGNVQSYKMSFVAKYPAGAPIEESSWLNRAIWGSNGETITIQYCLPAENNIPIVWIGYPVATPSPQPQETIVTQEDTTSEEIAQQEETKKEEETSKPQAEQDTEQKRLEEIRLRAVSKLQNSSSAHFIEKQILLH